jgi:hypothetical protein
MKLEFRVLVQEQIFGTMLKGILWYGDNGYPWGTATLQVREVTDDPNIVGEWRDISFVKESL